ncbi:MAG TPA: type II toxin-antitoxin system VapC family toxin [Phycicoccus sp.]|jgi:predicted nucleic acid-binding protein|nr:type II toxin-antitoxin system VapC family toxin [Phycicoccus sp.]HQH07331.1 type II toxin-antitoxin system VapC family toxin [Phycicoccus sp.]HQV90998.1 type II toxin-antitoxin system VapC family toxin [Phycicoccus sp.]HRA44183.1 type II toxin-antitoxin system VapC family toxin [Phycicoccus sp.]
MSLIVLDFNVVSEAMLTAPANEHIRGWLSHLPSRPATTVITRAEILAGIALLPAGLRRERLSSAAATAFRQLGSCLPLTVEATDRYAEVIATRRGMGRPIGSLDALIAAITLEARGTLATRNTKDFEGIGLDVINPWL